MTELTLPAPGKLNLFLHIIGQRPDGYHNLQTVFQFIDLCDSLTFNLIAEDSIFITPSMSGIEIKDNPHLQGSSPYSNPIEKASKALAFQ